jgi:endonuclease YncB( thermonuclease family)
MEKAAYLLMSFAVAFAIASCAQAPAAPGVPIVIDRALNGDTLTAQLDGRTVEIRLADIGAPQGSEPFAPSAKTFLGALAGGKAAKLEITGRDGPSRVFGYVRVGEIDLSMELVQRALAWVCWDYALRTDYMPYENQVRRLGAGVWASMSELDARTRCRARPPGEKPVGGASP